MTAQRISWRSRVWPCGPVPAARRVRRRVRRRHRARRRPRGAPSAAAIVLHETPDNLGCDSIGVEYKTVTFHIEPAAAEQVSALTDSGVSLVTYWPAGFKAGTAAERVVRDPAGNVVASDGQVLRAGQNLRGYGVCLSTSKLHVMLAAPSRPPKATTQAPRARGAARQLVG